MELLSELPVVNMPCHSSRSFVGGFRAGWGTAAVAALVSVAGGARAQFGPAQRAILGGVLDSSEGATVAIMRAGGAVFSGALVAPDVVLTAAHCLDDGPLDAVFLGPDLSEVGQVIDVVRAERHPGYVPSFAGSLAINDVACVLLASEVRDEIPDRISPERNLVSVGSPIRLLGYSTEDGVGAKRSSGITHVTQVDGGSSADSAHRNKVL